MENIELYDNENCLGFSEEELIDNVLDRLNKNILSDDEEKLIDINEIINDDVLLDTLYSDLDVDYDITDYDYLLGEEKGSPLVNCDLSNYNNSQESEIEETSNGTKNHNQTEQENEIEEISNSTHRANHQMEETQKCAVSGDNRKDNENNNKRKRDDTDSKNQPRLNNKRKSVEDHRAKRDEYQLSHARRRTKNWDNRMGNRRRNYSFYSHESRRPQERRQNYNRNQYSRASTGNDDRRYQGNNNDWMYQDGNAHSNYQTQPISAYFSSMNTTSYSNVAAAMTQTDRSKASESLLPTLRLNYFDQLRSYSDDIIKTGTEIALYNMGLTTDIQTVIYYVRKLYGFA